MTAEERREYNRRYWQEHKDYFKRYNEEHSDERKEYQSAYYKDNAETKKDAAKRRYAENAESVKKQKRVFRQTKEGRAANLANNYARDDESRGFSTSDNITAAWIIANVFSGQRCIYCGEDDWQKLGVDRIDNDKPHIAENCVCCCWDCNNERGRRYTFEEFVKMKER